MKRRNFLQAIASVVALFGVQKPILAAVQATIDANPNNLPVVRFEPHSDDPDDCPELLNAVELFDGVPFRAMGREFWDRRVRVWVNKEDAIDGCFNVIFHGEVYLYEQISEYPQDGKLHVGVHRYIQQTDESTIDHIRSSYFWLADKNESRKLRDLAASQTAEEKRRLRQ